MRKTLLFISFLFAVIYSDAQGIGMGTITPNPNRRLTVLALNNDTSIAGFFDGNVLGQGIQVVRGGVGIGPFRASNRLTVITDDANTGIDTAAAIYGLALSTRSGLEGGVYGEYINDSAVGVGVQGVGYFGAPFASFNDVFTDPGDAGYDIGLYGSATTGVLGLSIYESGVTGFGNIAGVVAQAFDFGDEDQPDERYGIYATAAGGGDISVNYAGLFDGDVSITGNLEKASGTFKIDHPLDPANKYLYHSFVESPDMMNIYNGNITTDANGLAVVTMPDYFNALNKEFRYQLTSIGTFSQAIVKEELTGNKFTIQTNQPNVKVSWQVTGIRHDKYADAHRVRTEVEKERQFKGFYLHPKEWGQALNRGIAAKVALSLSRPLTVKKDLRKQFTIAPQRKKPVKRLETYTMNENNDLQIK